jgi:hypothetical protein
VQVLQLAQFLENRSSDGALAGGEGNVCEWGPVVFAKLGGLCLFAVERKLLEIVEALQMIRQSNNYLQTASTQN